MKPLTATKPCSFTIRFIVLLLAIHAALSLRSSHARAATPSAATIPAATIPAAATTPAIAAPTLAEFTAHRTRQPGLVSLQWCISKEEIKNTKARGLAILRGEPGAAPDKIIAKLPLQFGKESDDHKTLTFSSFDDKAGKTSHKYAIAYLDASMKPGPPSNAVTIPPLGPPLKALSDLKAEVTDQGVRITWNDNNPPGSFAGYTISRNILGSPEKSVEMQKRSEPLPSTQRSYVDTTAPKGTGQIATYTIWTLSGDERDNTLRTTNTVHLP